MKRRWAPWLVFALWGLLAAALLVLAWSNRALYTIGRDGVRHPDVDYGFLLISVAIGLVYALVGLTIVVRTRHVIGWLLLAIAAGYEGIFACEQYVLHAVVADPGSMPAAVPIAMTTQWMAFTVTTSIVLILLLFPTGAPRSRRWRWAVRGAVAAALLYAVSYTMTRDAVRGPWADHDVKLHNPIAFSAFNSLLRIAFGIGVVASLVLAVAGVVCLVLRFRASRGTERQQIKYLLIVGIVLLVLFVAMQALRGSIGDYLWMPFFLTLMFGIPLAIGAAILRYKPYDIDRLISRTVSYALVTAVLAGMYVGFVVLFQQATRSFTQDSNLAVAASTLIVAAVFVPVRRRVQRIVDRRFNRSRYDAERTIDSFARRLREEVDLDTLLVEIQSVVGSKVHPAHLSVWMPERP